jgi:hypothetical protein
MHGQSKGVEMTNVRLKGTKTKGVWLQMLKPVKRAKVLLAKSKLGVLIEDTPLCRRTGKELFDLPPFKQGRIVCITREGIYTVREINSMIERGYYKLSTSPKEKEKKKPKGKK